MYLRHLTLNHYRTYARLELDLEPGVSVFIGENARGKTNLLEAIYLLAVGRVARAELDGEAIAWDASDRPPFARVAGDVVAARGEMRAEAVIAAHQGWEEEPTPSRPPRASKRFRINGVPRRLADFAGTFAATLFSVEDLAVVNGPPSGRRRYLDLTLTQTDRTYARRLQRYGRVLEQRNSLLRRIREGVARGDELSFWDDELVENGAAIVRARALALEALGDAAAEAHAALTDGRERLDLTYLPRLPACETRDDDRRWEEDAVASRLRAALESERAREVGAGMTLAGPHRDDVAFAIDGAPAGSFGSRAQQRTAALALRLAEARYLRERLGEDPVLLLDDVLSELDARRRDGVLRAAASFEQTLVTATGRETLPGAFLAGAATYVIERGAVRRA